MTALPEAVGQPASPAWDTQAACLGMDGELWFPAGYTTARDRMQAADAISICKVCPVARECLEDALAMERGNHKDGRHGIRGGLTPSSRFNVYRSRQRAGAQVAA